MINLSKTVTALMRFNRVVIHKAEIPITALDKYILNVRAYNDRFDAAVNPPLPDHLPKIYKMVFVCYGETTSAADCFYFDFAGIEE
jgi:hypothetical protein